jgi:hypothetical protein
MNFKLRCVISYDSVNLESVSSYGDIDDGSIIRNFLDSFFNIFLVFTHQWEIQTYWVHTSVKMIFHHKTNMHLDVHEEPVKQHASLSSYVDRYWLHPVVPTFFFFNFV